MRGRFASIPIRTLEIHIHFLMETPIRKPYKTLISRFVKERNRKQTQILVAMQYLPAATALD
jgi:hypothetical protein